MAANIFFHELVDALNSLTLEVSVASQGVLLSKFFKSLVLEVLQLPLNRAIYLLVSLFHPLVIVDWSVGELRQFLDLVFQQLEISVCILHFRPDEVFQVVLGVAVRQHFGGLVG